jgi:hypothetical protein
VRLRPTNESSAAAVLSLFNTTDVEEKRGSIRDTSDGKALIYFEADDRECWIDFSQLLPAAPVQGNEARVIYGEERGSRGHVVSVDGEDGVLRMSGDEGGGGGGEARVRIFPVALLCKVV